MSFESLGIAPSLLSTLEKTGFRSPTPVQTAAVPKALQGRDLMVSAQTGSGKTAAFMLPAIQRVLESRRQQNGRAQQDARAGDPANRESRADRQGRGGRARQRHRNQPQEPATVAVLVLAPTRELAIQVGQAAKAFAAGEAGFHVAVVVGGVSYREQLRALSRPVDVLVATPGRLMDHLNSGRVQLQQVQTLILDEADRMLDMGFIHDIRRIVGMTPESRQTLLFSATLDGAVGKLASGMMNDAEVIRVSAPKQQHANISQALLYADDPTHKRNLLNHLLMDGALDQAVVFTATKRGADRLARRLSKDGFASAALHGDMNQRQRNRTLRQLQRRQTRVLVATDVAARGIDIQGITHVINYDLPMQAEDYTHRIGRTGRAGNDGQAFTLAFMDELTDVRRIERFLGQPIPMQTVPGLEPTQRPQPIAPKAARKRAGRGRRRRYAGGGQPSARSRQARGGAGRSSRSAQEPRKGAAKSQSGYTVSQ